MRDRTVQVIIRVIPVLILVVFLLFPFISNGWDIGAAVLPVNPFLGIGTGLLSGIGGLVEMPRQGSPFSIQGSGFSEDGSRVFVDVMVGNPLPLQIDLLEFSGSIPAGSTVLNLAMLQPVSIPSGSSALVRLEGPRPQGLRPGGLTLPRNPTLGDLKMTLSVLGMEMTLDENAIRGMVS
jgi:hypothetical protein